jgi:t-SNARE complex subunit (syntaxin)
MHQIRSLELKKIESMLCGVVPTFFMVDQEVFNQAFVVVVVPSAHNADSDMSDEVSSVVDAQALRAAFRKQALELEMRGRF